MVRFPQQGLQRSHPGLVSTEFDNLDFGTSSLAADYFFLRSFLEKAES
jgi:hypothetical protein